MFHHVIAGIDGTDGGLDAVALARLLGARRLTLVSAYPGRSAPEADGSVPDDDLLRADALADLEDARRAASMPAELWPVAERSPARGLQYVAATEHADLICVGSSRHSRMARVLLGDVGRGVLDGAPCPVAITPRGYAEHGLGPTKVAVGYTATAESDAALSLAAAWAEEHGARVLVDIAWDVPHRLLAHGGGDITAERAHGAARAAMEHALSVVPDAIVDVTRGSADEVLLDAARRADLLVVGSRCWGPEGRVALGRTTERLVHHADCPMIVVPRPVSGDDEGAGPGSERLLRGRAGGRP